MRDTDKPEDKIRTDFVGEGAGLVFDAISKRNCTFEQFMEWVIDERCQANVRGYEEGYQDAKHYES